MKHLLGLSKVISTFMKLVRNARNVLVQIVLTSAWYFGLASGTYGFLLFIAGILDEFQGGWIPPKLAQFESEISSSLTVIGTLFAIASVYAPINEREPDEHSKIYSAPMIFIACLITIFLWITNGRPNEHVFNGISMLGIAIAILRLLSQKPRSF